MNNQNEPNEPIPQGTLDMLILQTLSRHGRLHGFEIATAIQQRSEDVLRVEEGSLYPALHRLEEAGYVRAKWTTTENKRRARMYEITAVGRKQLQEEESRWTSVAAAIGRVLWEA